jgi:hypothetical protein
MKRLSEWAKEQNLSYQQGWRKFQKNEIPNAQKLPNGSIVIQEVSSESPISQALAAYNTTAYAVDGNPVSKASTKTRRNGISTLANPADRYANIRAVGLPYKYGNNGGGSPNIDCRDMVELCRQAYFGFPVVRNIVELMVEFTCSDFFMTGGNKKSRDFFEAFWKRVNLKDFHKEFNREYWRSGNPFIQRLDAKITDADLRQMVQTFGCDTAVAAKIELPAKYILLDPMDIQLEGGTSFLQGQYVKVLNDYELECLRKPRTEEDKQLRDSLPEEVRKAIDAKNGYVGLPLDTAKTYYVPFGKQSYEPFGVSIIQPVLDDIEWKAQMKKMDAAIARTVQQAILLVTHGESTKDGGMGVNKEHLNLLQTIFQNESVGRVLISDYTTKAEFVIPQIADILDPEKYAVINQDIRDGLNNILVGGGNGEKFANKAISLNVFVERLRSAREVFIDNFLTPEIRRISKLLGFRQIPEIKFTEINLKDDLEFSRIYTRLVEIGALTPLEGLDAIETGRLPTREESLEHQAQYVEFKEKGFYQPLQGGLSDQKELAEINNDAKMEQQKQKVAQQNGRPPGSGKPIKKKVKPMRGNFSAAKLQELAKQATLLDTAIENAVLENYSLKELNENQKELCREVSELIRANETPDKWVPSITEYIKNPIDKNKEQVNEVLDIASEFGMTASAASLLYHAKIECQ